MFSKNQLTVHIKINVLNLREKFGKHLAVKRYMLNSTEQHKNIYFISPWAAIVKNIKAEKYKHKKHKNRDTEI